jgi:hypothetical protein
MRSCNVSHITSCSPSARKYNLTYLSYVPMSAESVRFEGRFGHVFLFFWLNMIPWRANLKVTGWLPRSFCLYIIPWFHKLPSLLVGGIKFFYVVWLQLRTWRQYIPPIRRLSFNSTKRCIPEDRTLYVCSLALVTIWPPLWCSGQSSWLQIQRSGFCSRRY